MKRAITLTIALIAGCSNGQLVNVGVPESIESSVYKKFLGIPALASMEGTYVRLNDNWVITAKHNQPLFIGDEFIPHPECDVALVNIAKEDFNGQLHEAKVFTSEITYFSGYPIGGAFTSTAGGYIGDLVFPNSKCLYSASSNHIRQGMSGGAVTNERNELVGVIVGYETHTINWPGGESHDSPAIFISINYIEDWINETMEGWQ